MISYDSDAPLTQMRQAAQLEITIEGATLDEIDVPLDADRRVNMLTVPDHPVLVPNFIDGEAQTCTCHIGVIPF